MFFLYLAMVKNFSILFWIHCWMLIGIYQNLMTCQLGQRDGNCWVSLDDQAAKQSAKRGCVFDLLISVSSFSQQIVSGFGWSFVEWFKRFWCLVWCILDHRHGFLTAIARQRLCFVFAMWRDYAVCMAGVLSHAMFLASVFVRFRGGPSQSEYFCSWVVSVASRMFSDVHQRLPTTSWRLLRLPVCGWTWTWSGI